MKVLHIAPRSFIGQEIGGGERYPWELAKAMSKCVRSTLLTFQEHEGISTCGMLTCKVYKEMHLARLLKVRPFSVAFLREIDDVDVVHLHQFRKIVTNLGLLFSRLRGKPVFVTDHGGSDFLSTYLFSVAVGRFATGFLPVSDFSGRGFVRYGRPMRAIYGGVDVERFCPKNIAKNEKQILFVGRIIPHKGIEYLVKAVQDLDVKLHLVGVPANFGVLRLLKSLDKNRKVMFRFSISDDELVNEYCSSLVTVLPSVYKDYYGSHHPIPELLGLVLLESMACGTPVLCTRVGGMPEIVEDGVNGFIINPNDPKCIKEKLDYLLGSPREAERMGKEGLRIALEKYTWNAVARRSLIAYDELS